MDTYDLKYRPKTYDEVIGQDEAISQLKGSLVRSYILQGPSGTGKTTLARILAKEINAELMEYDAASLGKADIEAMKEMVYYVPLLHPYKLILIDEVHNLSKQAWESLLKVIEECPTHTVWVLATTESHKVPETIITRSRVVEVKKVHREEIHKHLENISTKEGEEVPEGIIKEIVSIADGGVRKAVKLLETYVTTGTLGTSNRQLDRINLVKNIYKKNTVDVVSVVENYTETDLADLVRFITEYMTMIMVIQEMNTIATPDDGLGESVLERYTTINPDLIDDLRIMQEAIMQAVAGQGADVIERTIHSLYSLSSTLMAHYNMFNDPRTTTQGAVLWFMSQL